MDKYPWKIEHASLPGGLPPSRYRETAWIATAAGLEREGEFVGFPEVAREILRLAEENAVLNAERAAGIRQTSTAMLLQGTQDQDARIAALTEEVERLKADLALSIPPDNASSVMAAERARIGREMLAWLVEPMGEADAGLAGGRRIVDEIKRICPE